MEEQGLIIIIGILEMEEQAYEKYKNIFSLIPRSRTLVICAKGLIHEMTASAIPAMARPFERSTLKVKSTL